MKMNAVLQILLSVLVLGIIRMREILNTTGSELWGIFLLSKNYVLRLFILQELQRPMDE